jgi:hypothetical protein
VKVIRSFEGVFRRARELPGSVTLSIVIRWPAGGSAGCFLPGWFHVLWRLVTALKRQSVVIAEPVITRRLRAHSFWRCAFVRAPGAAPKWLRPPV